MQKLRFSVTRSSSAYTDAAYVTDGEDPTDALVETVHDNLSTELHVTIGEVTMFLAAWQDPEQWTDDWAETLGCSRDEVFDRVQAIVAAAMQPD